MKVKAIYRNGKIELLDKVPEGIFEVIVDFPDRFMRKKEDTEFIDVGIGIWKGRKDMEDSSEWVRKLRKKWSFRKAR